MYGQFSGTCHLAFSVNILQNHSTCLIILSILEGLCLLTVYKIIINSQEWQTCWVFTVSQKLLCVHMYYLVSLQKITMGMRDAHVNGYPHFTDEDS